MTCSDMNDMFGCLLQRFKHINVYLFGTSHILSTWILENWAFNMLQYISICCNILQYISMYFNIFQYISIYFNMSARWYSLLAHSCCILSLVTAILIFFIVPCYIHVCNMNSFQILYVFMINYRFVIYEKFQICEISSGRFVAYEASIHPWGNVWRRWHSGDIHHTQAKAIQCKAFQCNAMQDNAIYVIERTS